MDLETATDTDNEIIKVDNLISLLDTNTEEAQKRNLEIRKNTGEISTLSTAQKEIILQDEESNFKKKSVIESITRKVQELEIEHLHELQKASSNIGLQESEKATRIFDKVFKLHSEIINPHENDTALNNTKEVYDDIMNNIDAHNDEQGILCVQLNNLDTEYSQLEGELNVIKAERQNKARQNLQNLKIVAEFKEKEQIMAKEIESLRENFDPIKDLSLTTTKRITKEDKIVTIKINMGERQLELEPEKLSSTLVGQKDKRDKARDSLQEGESKWKNKVGKLYEGVDELFNPSTHEMEQRAQIHSLVDGLQSC